MPFSVDYVEEEPTRDEIDQWAGSLLLEFGAGWCGHCRALSPAVEALINARPGVHHLRIADGRGKPLGRSFRVKLWPTFVLLHDGQVLAQLVRPSGEAIRRALDQLPS